MIADQRDKDPNLHGKFPAKRALALAAALLAFALTLVAPRVAQALPNAKATEAIAQLRQEAAFKDGYPGYGQGGCVNFVNAVLGRLFDTKLLGVGGYTIAYPGSFRLVGSYNKPTAAQVKDLLLKAYPLDVVQMRGDGYAAFQHTFVVAAVDDEGITVWESITDRSGARPTGKVGYERWTWARFFSTYAKGFSRSDDGVSLYHASDYDKRFPPDVKPLDISQASVGALSSQPYRSGSAVEPEVAVTHGGATLSRGTHYELAYENNRAPGTATVHVRGVAPHTGETSATFRIRYFKDALPEDASSHGEAVDWMGVTGISEGWAGAEGTRVFKGLDTVKRCDFAAFLYRLADLRDDGARNDSIALSADKIAQELGRISDCDSSTPHAAEVAWLASTGITKGWDNGDGTIRFEPYATVARQDMAAFLYRYAALDQGAEAPAPGSGSGSFVDVAPSDDNADHAVEVAWLGSTGVSEGWPVAGGREFRGMEKVKRQDMAAFLNRLHGHLG